MTTPIQDIKAGEYELVAQLWDEQTSKPGEPFDFVRHVAGDIVKQNVEDARRLYAGGAVLPKGARQRAAVAAAKAQYDAALAALPEAAMVELSASAADMLPAGTVAVEAGELDALRAEVAAGRAAREAADAAAATPAPARAGRGGRDS